MSRSTKIALTMGDPRGIGPEIVAAIASRGHNPLIIFGDPVILAEAARLRGVPPPESWGCELIAVTRDSRWKNWDEVQCGRHSMQYVELATEYCLATPGTVMVTAPIHKHRWHLAHGSPIGHTEYLQQLSHAPVVGMMMRSPKLRVVPVTIHIPLKKVASELTVEKIILQCELTENFLKKVEGISKPHLALLGLNPHAGDGGTIGTEEQTIIHPAIETLRSRGITASGPYSADSFFSTSLPHDVVIAMYHDQGLIPIKALHFGQIANLTMGLPFIRSSPDHGTAEDISWQGKADAQHLAYAIETALSLQGAQK